MANVPVPASGAAPRPDKPIHPKGLYKAFAASLTGTALEWYDFAVYSAAAAVVFPLVFFPSSDPLTGTILAFSTYAVGYVSRPVGGIIFGRLGDRIGRKKVLVTTLMIIGVATVLIGVLPGYATIGIAAPIILVLLRFAPVWASAANGAAPSCSPVNTAIRTAAGSGLLQPRWARPPAT